MLNNIVDKTLFNAVFIRPEQVVRFWLCSRLCLAVQDGSSLAAVKM